MNTTPVVKCMFKVIFDKNNCKRIYYILHHKIIVGSRFVLGVDFSLAFVFLFYIKICINFLTDV